MEICVTDYPRVCTHYAVMETLKHNGLLKSPSKIFDSKVMKNCYNLKWSWNFIYKKDKSLKKINQKYKRRVGGRLEKKMVSCNKQRSKRKSCTFE